MTTEAVIGLAISAPVAIIAGFVVIVWRKSVAQWYRDVFNRAGRIGAPFANATTPKSMTLVGCGFLLVGLLNGARLTVGLFS